MSNSPALHYVTLRKCINHLGLASRFLIDTLNSHGFTCSYSEVKKYEKSAAVAQGTDIPDHSAEQRIQYVADNVDHNVATLDGSGTFHGRGIIVTKTPGSKSSRPVPRISVTAEDINAIGRVNIEYFEPASPISPFVYKPLVDWEVEDPTHNLDVLWKTSLILHSPRPGWSGMMQMVNNGEHPGQSSVMFLPMIDMNPSDPSCVYSTLRCISSHAARYNVTPVLTFDQPLWWKAITIVRSHQVTMT